jgi:hypothetical protein
MRDFLIPVAVIICAVAVSAMLVSWIFDAPILPRLQHQQDSLTAVFVRDTADWAVDTLATDSATIGVVVPVKAVKKERKSAGKALKTAGEQKKNYEKQIKALTPTLRLFGKLELSDKVRPSIGVAVRPKRLEGLDVEVSKDLGGPWRVAVRKDWRLY